MKKLFKPGQLVTIDNKVYQVVKCHYTRNICVCCDNWRQREHYHGCLICNTKLPHDCVFKLVTKIVIMYH